MFKCDICKTSYLTKRPLDKHIASQKCVPFDKKTLCSLCDIVFYTNKQLRKHMVSREHYKKLNIDIPRNKNTNKKEKKTSQSNRQMKEQVENNIENVEHSPKVENMHKEQDDDEVIEDDEVIDDSELIEEEVIEENPILLKLKNIYKNEKSNKVLLKYLTECDITDYHKIYVIISDTNNDIDRDMRTSICKVMLYFRNIMVDRYKKGFRSISGKEIYQIIKIFKEIT